MSPSTEPTEGTERDPEPILAVELTKDEYAQLADQRTFVLPVAILEEHGPHLPLGTDGFQVEAVVHEAAAATGSVVLPTLWYGNCVSTKGFPGSISISFDTLRALTADILEELARHGVKSLAIVSGHAGGGHMRALKLAVRDKLDQGMDMRVGLLSEWDLLFALDEEDLEGVEIPAGDGHAGAMETARMLYDRPELVKQPPSAHVVDEEPHIVPKDPSSIWPDGYGGDPSQATDKMGKVLHDRAVEGLTELFEALAR